MATDFIIVYSGKPDEKAVPEEASAKDLVEKWFSSVKKVSLQTITGIKQQVQHKLEEGACRHMLPKSLSEGRSNYELLLCIEQTVAEQWDLLTPDERLLIRFPIAKEVGDRVAIPQKGEGILIRRELTRRFGIEMVFQLQDGSFFKWEIVD